MNKENLENSTDMNLIGLNLLNNELCKDGAKRSYLLGVLNNFKDEAISYFSHNEKKWYLGGALHNFNGPSVITDKFKKYFLFNVEIDEKDYNEYLSFVKSKDYKTIFKIKNIKIKSHKVDNGFLLEFSIKQKNNYRETFQVMYAQKCIVSLNEDFVIDVKNESEPSLKIDDLMFWVNNGILHRKDNPAIKKKNGDSYWFLDGLLHREGSPAVEKENEKHFWVKNKLHNEDGYAYETTKSKIYFIDNNIFTKKEFEIFRNKKLLDQSFKGASKKNNLKV